jgi:hypothetical protein
MQSPYLPGAPYAPKDKWKRALRLAGQIVESEDDQGQGLGMEMPRLTQAPRPSIPQAMQPYMPKYELPPILEFLQRSMGGR